MNDFILTDIQPPDRRDWTSKLIVKLIGQGKISSLGDISKIHDFYNDEFLAAIYYDNDTYRVKVNYGLDMRGIVAKHLAISRHDKNPIREWRDLQEIKNKLCGPESEAVELFPAESRLVDTANVYHLWAYERPFLTVGFRIGRQVFDFD